jgi:hypothetical protein
MWRISESSFNAPCHRHSAKFNVCSYLDGRILNLLRPRIYRCLSRELCNISKKSSHTWSDQLEDNILANVYLNETAFVEHMRDITDNLFAIME